MSAAPALMMVRACEHACSHLHGAVVDELLHGDVGGEAQRCDDALRARKHLQARMHAGAHTE